MECENCGLVPDGYHQQCPFCGSQYPPIVRRIFNVIPSRQRAIELRDLHRDVAEDLVQLAKLLPKGIAEDLYHRCKDKSEYYDNIVSE